MLLPATILIVIGCLLSGDGWDSLFSMGQGKRKFFAERGGAGWGRAKKCSWDGGAKQRVTGNFIRHKITEIE